MADRYLLEASWEVCNKVGGIYTVVTSKLPSVLSEFKDGYTGIGPWMQGVKPQYFEETEAPDEIWYDVSNRLQSQGVIIHFGIWTVPQKPRVMLVDYSELSAKNNEIKAKYWEKYGLETFNSDYYDVDVPILWSTAVGMITETLANIHFEKGLKAEINLHAHEWMSCASILHLKNQLYLYDGSRDLVKINTLFTTHATALGRALTSRGIFHEAQSNIDPDLEARNIGVLTKHQIEKMAGQIADHFTTVSEVTRDECTRLLGVTPKVVENGLDTDNYPDFIDISINHRASKKVLQRFLANFFFPYYRFDLSKTKMHFTMGRYEFHNKGYDLHLQTLAELNNEMKAKKSDEKLVTFFMVPGDSIGLKQEINVQLALAQEMYHLAKKDVINSADQLLEDLWAYDAGDDSVKEPITLALTNETRQHLEILANYLPNREGNPPLSPFNMRNNDEDSILKSCHELGLLNREEDPVKIVFLPVYLDGYDGIFNSPLYDLIVGCDLGIFASAYEPWGYTPMESLLMGVPGVLSTLSGFGQVCSKIFSEDNKGMFILDRKIENDGQAIHDLKSCLSQSLFDDSRLWTERKIEAQKAVQEFNWKKIYPKYSKLYI